MIEIYWLEQPAAEVPPDDGWLSPAERSRLACVRFEKRRSDWRLGRWTAKLVVAARYSRVDLSSIEIRAAPSGAPEVLVRDRPAPVTISLSHRDGIAICAIGPPGLELGCDLELIEERDAAFTADYFTAAEQAMVQAAPGDERLRMQTLIWSAKESALKAVRAGLRLDTRSVEVHPCTGAGSHEWHSMRVSSASGRVLEGWWKERDMRVWTFVANSFPGIPIPIAGVVLRNIGNDRAGRTDIRRAKTSKDD